MVKSSIRVIRIDHVGIACRSVERGEGFYAGVLGLPVASRETLGELKLKVVRLQGGEAAVELLEPLEGEEVIAKFLAARGEGIHHICFEVGDVAEATRELAARGYRPVWEEPRPGAGGRLVQFLRPRETFGVLIELAQPPTFA